jgi:predicted transcriptional regulator of viral defense system
MTATIERAISIISGQGGTVRTSEALNLGIHPRTLYELRDSGVLESVGRGVFRLSGLPPLGDPDLALVSKRIPGGIVCLVSSLSLHDLTTQIPHFIHLALPRTARYPVIREIPLKVYRFSDASYRIGIVDYDIGGAVIQTYCPEKTIADCFKYRNKLGIDLILEALSNYKRRTDISLPLILEYARANHVERQIRPYLEAFA